MLPVSNLRTPRRLAVFFTLLAMSLSLFQCKKADDPEPVGGDTNLVASWAVTKYGSQDIRGVETDETEIFKQGGITPCLFTLALVFQADGKATKTGREGCNLGRSGSADDLLPSAGGSTWVTNGSTLTITAPDGKKTNFTYELSGSILRLLFPTPINGGKDVITLAKS